MLLEFIALYIISFFLCGAIFITIAAGIYSLKKKRGRKHER
jgi:Flp pilus assembly protein TadG